jgi:DNA repair protein RecN (Recombination protein N)
MLSNIEGLNSLTLMWGLVQGIQAGQIILSLTALIPLSLIYLPFMLSQLSIRNYAIVDALEIDFKPGMSVITGETGAGKSIILGALGLTLGDRADKNVVRTGTDKTEISAEFTIDRYPAVQQWLQDNELDDACESSQCLLRRVVGADGRSRAYINGRTVTLGNLTELGEMLMDIHSQHEHQSLLQKSTHLRLLDDFGVDSALLDELRQTWTAWRINQQQVQQLSRQSDELSAQMELIGYQVAELDELDLQDGELHALEEEFQELNNADTSIAILQQVVTLCQSDEENNVGQQLHHARALLDGLPHKTATLSSVVELLTSALIQVEEAVTELQRSLDRMEINPERLESVNQRLADIHRLARKHKVKPEALVSEHVTLREQLARFANSDASLEELKKQDTKLRQQYLGCAEQLSEQRKKAAKTLSSKINKQLKTLGMPDAKLEVLLSESDREELSVNGLEMVEFLISTNPGQAAKPLIKIASGGELSRISLAIQVTTAQTSRTPTLVFDEVDVGIGGGIAKEVGRLLHQLGEHAQIVCVTHQAQVASQGHQHFFVSKKSSGKSTASTIIELTGKEKVREVARMLSGEVYTEESLAHAEQLVANS